MRRPDHKPSYVVNCLLCQKPARSYVSKPRTFCSYKCRNNFQRLVGLLASSPFHEDLRLRILEVARDEFSQAA